MPSCRTLFLGVVLLWAAVGAAAQTQAPPVEPVLRSDAARSVAEARIQRLREMGPPARPVHMVRHAPRVIEGPPPIRPPSRQIYIPETQWDHIPDSDDWVHGSLRALRAHGGPLDDLVPADIDRWCPAYRQNPPPLRRAFWIGLMSALSYHESRYQPRAVGGGGRWFGLLQVWPPTARHFGCDAQSGAALKDPVSNLSCSVRIMAVQVPRYGTVSRGMRDWGPFHSADMRAQMAAWTREQDYCRPQLAVMASLRPRARPEAATEVASAPSQDSAEGRLSTMGD